MTDQTNEEPSADDLLEASRFDPLDTSAGNEHLNEDSDRPFAPTKSSLDDTHPATDTDVDPSDAYENGLSAAAGAEEPNASSDVIDFDEDEVTKQPE